MEIGCHLPNQGPLATRAALTTFAAAAEQRDVASLWVSDHVIFPRTATGNYPGGRFPHPPDKPYLEPAALGGRRQPGRVWPGGRAGRRLARDVEDAGAVRRGAHSPARGGRRRRPSVRGHRAVAPLRAERRPARQGPAGGDRHAGRVPAARCPARPARLPSRRPRPHARDPGAGDRHRAAGPRARVIVNTLAPCITQLAGGLRFPEGPIAMPDGSVILVEIERRTLSRVTADGAVHVVATLGGGPNGA